MKIHLPWIRVAAAAVLVAGVGVHQAAAQYAPYRPIPQQPAAPAPAVPQQAQLPANAAPATQTPYSTAYTAYRSPTPANATTYAGTPQPTPAYGKPTPTQSYGSPTGAQYTQPTAAYPQYPQTAAQQYPQTGAQQYPANYGAYSYVAQQPTPEQMPAPKQSGPSAAQPSNAEMAAPAASMPSGSTNMSGQPGACGCNASNYGANDYYTTPGAGCAASGGYPNCGATNYCDAGCNDNQWFGGVYALGMTRTNATPIKLTSQMPTGGAYPYYPQPDATIMTNRDVNYDWRAGLEVRLGSTFTIGEPCSTCQSSCGYNTGCGCNSGCGSSCAPTTYAWEVAWWGLDNSPNEDMVSFNGTDRIYGMKTFIGLEFDRDGGGGTYVYRPVNDYYDYQMPITAPPTPTDGYIRLVSQRVRTDFRAQNLELNFIRFPVCNTGCSTGCASGGCNGGCDASGCSSNYSGCNGGCDDSCGCGFAMYGSCGVRYFQLDDDFMYGTEYEEWSGGAYGAASDLNYNIDVKNRLVGPQVGWTTDYCLGKWNLFCNSTFGIFDNHSSVWQRMNDGDGNWSRFIQDGSTFNVRTSKDSVAFLGELRVGAAYDISCHWRGVLSYRAVAITGLATAAEQMSNIYTDRATVGLIDSDNGVIIHGVQVGAECRY